MRLEAIGTGNDKTPSNRTYSQTHTEHLQELIDSYVGEPIEVSFRKLVGVLPADESTHGIFPYPARLLRHIPRLLLASRQVASDIEYAIDPFCGSGTILLEARTRNLPVLGIDQNPIATLVSRVKTSRLDESRITLGLGSILERSKLRRGQVPPSSFLTHWYSQASLSALSRIASVVQSEEDEKYRDFFSLVLALTARKVSFTDPRIPVPVRHKKGRTDQRASDVWNTWATEGNRIALKVSRLSKRSSEVSVKTSDSRLASAWASERLGQASLVITSPPYGAAQKYIRSTSLDAGWLGFAADAGTIDMERSSIGREHLSSADRNRQIAELADYRLVEVLEKIRERNAARAEIYVNYFLDMEKVLSNAADPAVNCQKLVMISGTNVVSGLSLPTHEHLADMAKARGFSRIVSLRDPIRGRSLLTARKSTGTPAAAEHIDIFTKD